ncbi:MAG: cytochrome d ubiquinol oxidase subunit II, partial [Burkholderiales bacterium]
KTTGPLQARMRRIGRPLTLVLLAVVAVISIWTPVTHQAIAERWFGIPNILIFMPVPILFALCTWLLYRALGHHREAEAGPFFLTLCLVFLAYSGLGISVWPNVVPPDISIWQAAAPPQSMGFTLVGALLIVPTILAYTAWSYYVFRGKVDASAGYH